jgi:hypothetical protein
MRIEKGERLYKLFIFRPRWGRANNFEYRVFTKEKADGTLELVAYNFKLVGGLPHKSGIIRAPSVPKEVLSSIIQGIVRQTNTRPDELEEVDLSGFATVEEQIEELKRRDRASIIYLH